MNIPGDTMRLDYTGKLIYHILDWIFTCYPTTSSQLVNIARQVQYTTTPASLHNSLVNYQNVFACASDQTEQMAKAYLLLRVLYQLPQEMYSNNARTFGGWIHPSIGSGTSFNMAWPVSATQSPSGVQVMISGYTGFIGRGYNAAEELDYFNNNFQRRNL